MDNDDIVINLLMGIKFDCDNDDSNDSNDNDDSDDNDSSDKC